MVSMWLGILLSERIPWSATYQAYIVSNILLWWQSRMSARLELKSGGFHVVQPESRRKKERPLTNQCSESTRVDQNDWHCSTNSVYRWRKVKLLICVRYYERQLRPRCISQSPPSSQVGWQKQPATITKSGEPVFQGNWRKSWYNSSLDSGGL